MVTGGTAFNNYFSESIALKEFQGYGDEFYKNVHCGILHQGETYNGWKILRKGDLFQKAEKTVNATKYLEALKKDLEHFIKSLKAEPFNSKVWKGVIKKLEHVCQNSNA